MFNFFLIIILFILVLVLLGKISNLKIRLRLIEEKLAPKKQEAVEKHEVIQKTETDPWAHLNKSKVAHKSKLETQKSATEKNIFQSIYDLLTNSNSIVAIGMLVLFIGIAFLLKYAADTGHLPISLRLVGVAILALALFFIGFILEKKRFNYALILEGGALAILYLLSFTGFYYYQITSASFTLVVLIIITAFTLAWSYKRDTKILAILGVIGGFAAPLLVRSESHNYFMLFNYYLILNLGIFVLAWFRNWRELNIIGFVFTFVVTALWYSTAYSTEQFYQAEAYLLIFFGFYLVVAILSAIKQPVKAKGFIETSLVFALPIVVFFLQAFLLSYQGTEKLIFPMFDSSVSYPLFKHNLWHLALSALGFGSVYAIVSAGLFYYKDQSLKLLAWAFALIAAIFFTLAVPLLFSQTWTIAIWALEAVAMIWIGIQQSRINLRMAGMLLIFIANLYFYYKNPVISQHGWDGRQIFDGLWLLLADFLAAYLLYKNRNQGIVWEENIGKVFFAMGCLWLLSVVYYTAAYYWLITYESTAILILLSLSALLARGLEKILAWPWMKVISLSLLPLMILIAFNEEFTQQLFIYGGDIGIFWLIAFVVWYVILYSYREQEESDYMNFSHIGAYVLITWIFAWDISQYLTQQMSLVNTWSWCVWGFIPAIFLAILYVSKSCLEKTFKNLSHNYTRHLSWGFVLYLLAWVFLANWQLEGNSAPWHYFLLVNPLDITSLFALIISFLALQRLDYRGNLMNVMFAIVVFVWANAAILRYMHFAYGVPFTFEGILNSQLTQVVLSLFWGIIALVTTVIGYRKQYRNLWFCGATMIVLTILKLFLVDLSNSGTLERIIAFIGIGAILLVIGYFAPLPPKASRSLSRKRF